MKFKQGIFDIEESVYFKEIDAWSQSYLKQYCANTYKANQEFKKSKAMDLGTYFHHLILEPEVFHSQYRVCDIKSRNAKAFKEFCRENVGYTCITITEMNKLQLMSEGLNRHSNQNYNANDLIANCTSFEKVALWNDRDFNYELKGRIDGVSNDYLFDLKTTSDCKEFRKSFYHFGYDYQAAFYLDGYNQASGKNIKDFYFVVSETSDNSSHDCIVVKLKEETLNLGRAKYKDHLNKLKSIIDSNVNGYVNSFIEL